MSRTIVITGGGTGIGRAVAARFAAAGDAVTILGRRADVLEHAAAEIGATALPCDVTDPDALARALPGLPTSVDVLVNAAGGNRGYDEADAGGLAGIAAAWRSNLDANVLSAVLTTAALDDRLASGGSVVAIGSIAASRGGGSYGAAKAALHNWNMTLAADLGPRDITANVVSCGYIADTEFFRDSMTAQRRATLIGQTALERAGTPADVAGVVAYLASADARHVTAQTLHVNGGAWPTQ